MVERRLSGSCDAAIQAQPNSRNGRKLILVTQLRMSWMGSNDNFNSEGLGVNRFVMWKH